MGGGKSGNMQYCVQGSGGLKVSPTDLRDIMVNVMALHM